MIIMNEVDEKHDFLKVFFYLYNQQHLKRFHFMLKSIKLIL